MKELIRQFIQDYRLPVFLGAAVVLAIVLVIVSMTIYYNSGAHQLDLSRPEYKGVRSQIEPDRKASDVFDSQGPVDQQVLDEFLTKYQQEAQKAYQADAYSTDVLSNEQLGI